MLPASRRDVFTTTSSFTPANAMLSTIQYFFSPHREVMMKRLITPLLILAIILSGATIMAAAPIVNEIMYAPASSEPEWVELYNPTSAAIDLSGWSMIDA